MNVSALVRFCDAAGDYADWLNRACARFVIANGPRLQMFLAQFAHESRGFTRMEENLNYTHADHLWRTFRSKFDLDHDKAMDPDELRRAETYLHNPEKLANLIYAGRFGNGDEASGDGWRFRGRGIGITFKGNYQAASMAIYGGARLILPTTHDEDGQTLTGPDLVAEPEGACLTAGWFWQAHGCNELADSGDFDSVTRVINPGMAGAAERRDWFEMAQEVFP